MSVFDNKVLTTGTLAAGLAAALALMVAAGGARSGETQSPAPTAAKELEKKLENRAGQLETVESRSRELQKDVADIAAEREKINARLLETAALIQKSEAQMTAIEARLGNLDAQEKLVRGSLNERYDHIAKLLSALQRMGRNPPPVMITRREDALKMVRSAMLLAAAFPEMKNKALELTGKLNDLTRVMTDIRAEGERLKAETSRLNDMRTKLAGLMETKKRSLSERQADLSQARAAAVEISKSVNDLNDLISKLDQEVSKNVALQAYEEESKGEAAAGGESPEAKPPDVAALVAPPKASGTPVVELAPGAASLVLGNPGRIKPAIAFQLAKAKLPLPAQGRRVLSFGDKTQYGGISKGLVIETRSSAQVTSPCDGWIVYAGEFRSYGQLLIINAGGGYHVLVAGLSQIDVQPGQFVLTAEPVGTMGGAPRSTSGSPGTTLATAQKSTPETTQASAQSNSPVLYVEFRKDGQPIDPDPWWVDVHQKVQG